MTADLAFGWRTAILSVAVLQLLMIAAALLRPIENRRANRALALLLVILCGVLTPWMIGFAGFYDKWRFLTFAPFSITLAVAPLFYFYIHAMVSGAWPERKALHLAPAAVQFAYLAGAFLLLRQPFKNDWLDQASPVYSLVTGAGIFAGLIYYGAKSLALLARYRRGLVSQRSDDHRYAGRWLTQAIWALFALSPVWALYSIADLIAPISYKGFMGLYIAIAAFALFTGVEGWRHAALHFPKLADMEAEPVAADRDWATLGTEWARKVSDNRWHGDPEVSLSSLARLLGTNTAYLSRAVNDGLGVNLTTFINNLRSDDVAAAIRAGNADDLIDLALAAGFSSKASFNRAFRARFNETPSAYRRRHGSKAE